MSAAALAPASAAATRSAATPVPATGGGVGADSSRASRAVSCSSACVWVLRGTGAGRAASSRRRVSSVAMRALAAESSGGARSNRPAPHSPSRTSSDTPAPVAPAARRGQAERRRAAGGRVRGGGGSEGGGFAADGCRWRRANGSHARPSPTTARHRRRRPPRRPPDGSVHGFAAGLQAGSAAGAERRSARRSRFGRRRRQFGRLQVDGRRALACARRPRRLISAWHRRHSRFAAPDAGRLHSAGPAWRQLGLVLSLTLRRNESQQCALVRRRRDAQVGNAGARQRFRHLRRQAIVRHRGGHEARRLGAVRIGRSAAAGIVQHAVDPPSASAVATSAGNADRTVTPGRPPPSPPRCRRAPAPRRDRRRGSRPPGRAGGLPRARRAPSSAARACTSPSATLTSVKPAARAACAVRRPLA